MTNQEIQDAYETLMEMYEELKREIRSRDKMTYERWKAGGFIIDPDILSMYPCLETIVENIVDEEEEDDD